VSLALQLSQPAPVHAVLLVLMALEAWVVQQVQMCSECDNSFTLQQGDVCEPCVAVVTASTSARGAPCVDGSGGLGSAASTDG